MKRLFLLLIVLVVLLPTLAAAQSENVTLTARIGLGGVIKQNAWAPAVFTIANSGNDLQGEIEWRWDTGGEVFAQTLDLPRDGNKQVVLPIRTTNFSTNGTARFLVGGKVVAKQAVVVDSASAEQSILAIIGDEGQALVGIVPDRNSGPSPRTLQLTLNEIPDRAELLAAVNWLMLSGDTTRLHAEQQAALRSWVDGGGVLVINGARPETAQGIGELAPATADSRAQNVPVGEIVTKNTSSQSLTIGVLHLAPRTGTTARTSAGGVTTSVRQVHGHGAVIQLGFDLVRLRDAGITPAELAQLIDLQPNIFLATLQPQTSGLLQQALRLPALRLPSVGALLGFMLCYIILVGPLNYLLLRRWDRREWAYFTIPLTVAIFTAGAYIWGAAGRGPRVLVNELAVVRTASGATTGQATTEVGIYSPTRRSYTLGFPADALIGPTSSNFRRTVSSPIRTLRTETAVEVPNVLVDVGSLQSFTAEQTISVPVIRATRTRGSNGTLSVHNAGNQTLQDVVVAQGREVTSIGTLAPGAERQITLPINGFLGTLNLQDTGVINRQEVMTTLVEGFGFNSNGPVPAPLQKGPIAIPVPGAINPADDPTAALVVFAWLPQSQLPVQIDGRSTSARGETLLIVGADDAPAR